MALVTVQDVTMAYEAAPVIEHISFSVESADYMVIFGENGSGKSTLVKGMLGLLKPRSGKIVYGDGLRQNGIGYLPQQTTAQRDFPASVTEVVLSGCLNSRGFRPFYGKVDREKAYAAMEKLSIYPLRKKSYRELSGGQQQRVLLARALCATQKLLLLDEPVTGLDPEAAREMYRVIGELNRTENVGIIMISHDPEGALLDAKRVLRLGNADTFFGTAEEYREKFGGTGEGRHA